MQLYQLTFTLNCHSFSGICHFIQLLELPLLRVVISCSNQWTNSHCNQNYKAINPCSTSILWICCPYSYSNWYDTGHHKYFLYEVVQSLFEKLAERCKRRGVSLVVSILHLSGLYISGIDTDSTIFFGSKSLEYPGGIISSCGEHL